MKLNLSTLSLLFVLLGSAVWAQPAGVPAPGGALNFEKTTHDFGELKQSKPEAYTFVFTNSSTQPIKLTTVRASCGCTTPTWTKEAIPGGGKGEIKVQYNAAKIGPFNKSIHVVYDSLEEKSVNLFIKGTVLAPPGTESNTVMTLPGTTEVPKLPEIKYNIPRGALSFEKMIENLAKVTSETTGTVEFRFKNTSDKEVRILDDVVTEGEVSVTIQDKVLKPGQESKIIATVDGRKMKTNNAASGFYSKAITIHTDEATEADKRMTVSGTYERVITQAERDASPKVVFEKLEVDGGKVIEGENWVYDYKFTNQGKGELVIESAKASCGCTATKPPEGKFAFGQGAAVTASFNSTGRVGKQSKTITVTTNDVENPVITLKFTVEVVKDPFHSGGMMNANQ